MICRSMLVVGALALVSACGTNAPVESASNPTPSAEAKAAAQPTAPTTATPTQNATSAATSAATPAAAPAPSTPAMKNDVYALSTNSLDGAPAELSNYRGKVTLIVNVASACGYTPQYAGLQKLHAEFADRGFAVLGFPSNEFGGQEPGSAAEIAEFCSSKFGVAFPMFAKCETKAGASQSPVYAALEGATGKLPNWNFCKYLVGKDGQPIAFYPSKVTPESAELRDAIEKALK